MKINMLAIRAESPMPIHATSSPLYTHPPSVLSRSSRFAAVGLLGLALTAAPAWAATQGGAASNKAAAHISPEQLAINAGVSFRLASFLIEERQPEAACRVLNTMTAPPSLEANRLYLLSHCLEAQGKAAEAIQAMERTVALLPDAATPRAELASLYARQGQPQAARIQLVAAAERDPNPESSAAMQSLAERLGANDPAALARVAQAKPWSVEVFAGLVYDTNINGGPSSDLVPGVIGAAPVNFRLNQAAMPREAWGTMGTLSASYKQALSPRVSLLYQGGLSRTDYFGENRFRNDTLSLAAALIYQGDDYAVSVQPSLSYQRQADLLQEADTGVTARVTKALSPTWNITGSLGYLDRRIQQDRNRDAQGVNASLGFNTLLAPNLKVGADYMLMREHARQDMFSRRMTGPSVYAIWQPRVDVQLIANYRYQRVDYDQKMPFFADAREDRQQMVGLTALWDISRYTGRNMAVRAQYMYIDNPSNVGTNDYDRQLVMMGVQMRF